MRRHLYRLAVVWLFCQAAALVAAPAALGRSHFSTLGAIEECECPGTEAGQACPMHSGGNRTTPVPESDCRLQSPCTPSDAALLSLTGGLGAPIDRAAA